MRLVFFGTPDLAVAPLAAVAAHHDVVSLVCQPDRPSGRGRKPAASPAKIWALEHGIPVHQPAKLNDGSFEAWLRERQPEICVVAAYGRLLKEPILAVPEHGFLNLHPSLLPKYRGPSPIQSAILNGDTVTGVTIMKIVLEMDAGDILLQREEPIHPEDTSATLGARLASIGAALFVEALGLVASGEALFTPQDESKVVRCRLFEKSDGQIEWDRPARAIHNLVRAAAPWPVAHSPLKGEMLRIHRTEVLDRAAATPPGTVEAVETDRLVVGTGEGVLALLEVQAPGKKTMPVSDFLRGRKIEPGDRFGDP